VRYTVWSRGRLVGESKLAYGRAFPKLRAGDFFPSELGHKLMPIIVGVGPALSSFHDVVDEARLAGEAVQVGESGQWSEKLRQTTEYADATSIPDELESLALELRDDRGRVVKTDWIHIQDTHRLLAFARQCDDEKELEPDPEYDDEVQAFIDQMEFEDDPEPWNEPELARYQIMVALAGHDRYMERLATRRRRRR